MSGLIAEENALLGRIGGVSRVHARDTTRVRTSCVYRECTIDVTAGLIELDGLPGVFGGLTDARTLDYALVLLHVLPLVTIALHVLPMNVPLNLILAKPQWQI